MGLLTGNFDAHAPYALNAGHDADCLSQPLEFRTLLDMGFDEGGDRDAKRSMDGFRCRGDRSREDLLYRDAIAIPNGKH